MPQRAEEGWRDRAGEGACKVDREEVGREVVPVV